MNQEDSHFMKRAIALARLGMGLVSPNPMVGALLVKEGRVLGVGYHRYDKLRHAESYAIEMAGNDSQGSTLYCSLEPCCHQGRTPPCTDALIAAGITRAVIAIKDPNPLVDGRGIEQLSEAGIEVDLGLCEEEAARLNECYFKFITGRGPFVHGVIEYPAQSSDSAAAWIPSPEFLDAASEYDSLVLGSRLDLNRLLIESRLNRERHRPFVIVVGAKDAEDYRDLFQDERASMVSFITLATRGNLRAVDADTGSASRLAEDPAEADFDATLEALARMGVIGVLVVPGVVDPAIPVNFESLDKLTLAVPGGRGEDDATVDTSHLAFADLEFDLEQASVTEAGTYTEFTGYPHLRGVA
jgi:diaminohydroxyphosphoribosylaminopyrimidine deaminase/5-amino-6-(5-phosphoribosylamino)uracil reductase